MSTLIKLNLVLTLTASLAAAANPYIMYQNEFVDPDYVVANAGKWPANTNGAQDSVIAWADELASHGPWSVTFKPVVAPSGDKHDYMSWAPYQWPDCTKAKNTTELTPAQIRTTCPYVNRDGQVNPDRNIPDDFQSFFNLSDAVLYNSIASTFAKADSANYAQTAVKFLQTWFIDSDTAMSPNLNFAQMHLGPTGQKGTFTGVLDLRMMVKIASGVLILRKTKAPAWTSDLDASFVSWCKQYISWLQKTPIAQQALKATNNHGTHANGQLMALQILVGDTDGATSTGRAYFGGAFNGQIAANGEQPLEATRTRPYHYRNFNIVGMVIAARLLKYVDPSSNAFNSSSIAPGATIQKAVDFVMGVDPTKDQLDGYDSLQEVTEEIYPNIAAVASTYGDADGKYVGFLENSGFAYADDAFFLWDQPLKGGDSSGSTTVTSAQGVPSGSGSGGAAATGGGSGTASADSPSGTSGSGSSGSGSGNGNNSGSNGSPAANAGGAASAADTSETGTGIGGLAGAGAIVRPQKMWSAVVILLAVPIARTFL